MLINQNKNLVQAFSILGKQDGKCSSHSNFSVILWPLSLLPHLPFIRSIYIQYQFFSDHITKPFFAK